MLDSNLCILCGYSISDPVCKRCYMKQTEILLNDLNRRKINRELILRKIRNKFLTAATNETGCILCGEDNVALCRHCFSIILKDALMELNFTEETIENFGCNLLYEENYLDAQGNIKRERGEVVEQFMI